MQVSKTQVSQEVIKLSIVADQAELDAAKQAALQQLSKNVRVPGFRAGKAPAGMVEKHIDQAALQSEFLDQVINRLYVEAVGQEQLRPVAQPKIEVGKFVPFTTLEFTAEIEAVGDIKLPNYKTMKLALKKPTATAKDVNEVLETLRQRAASKQDVTRAAKSSDEVTIDFAGSDAENKEPITGADGKDYPLVLGSNSFIPGFEDELIGLKPGASKTFDIVFPKDYASRELQSRKVTFVVTVSKISELKPPTLDDKFAASVGPFKTLAALKTDVKKQLLAEKQQEAERSFDNEFLEKIAAKTTVAIPKALIEEEIDRMEDEEKRSVAYRGQTWQEHLAAESVTAEEHREKQRQGAELRVKAGLVLGEISRKEKITATQEEVQLRVQLLKNQYTDPQMQTELDKPENQRDLMNRLLTEKTLDKLRSYATTATPSTK